MRDVNGGSTVKRRRRLARADVYSLDWHDSFQELFRLAPNDWPRPAKVQVRRTSTGMTIVGWFEDQDGHPAKISLRLQISMTGNADVVSEKLSIGFLLRPGAPA